MSALDDSYILVAGRTEGGFSVSRVWFTDTTTKHQRRAREIGSSVPTNVMEKGTGEVRIVDTIADAIRTALEMAEFQDVRMSPDILRQVLTSG